MRTSLVTREEMIEAIEQHTACISTVDIPGVIANYFMITKQLYRRKDKNAVHRILLSDIREYLLEQGHLNYATVAAEARKEAHRMKATNVKSEKFMHLQFRNRSWWLFRISLMKFPFWNGRECV